MRAVLPLACVLALASFGCGDNTIMLMDSGTPGTDTGTPGTDGGGGTDAGVDAPSGPCGTVNANALEALPASCLPRCSAATFSAVAGCSGETAAMCQQSAVAADTTPGALVNVGAATPQEFTCDECFLYQIQHCLNEVCPTEMMAFLTCAAAGDPATANSRCATEIMAVNACGADPANMTPLGMCQQDHVVACFAR